MCNKNSSLKKTFISCILLMIAISLTGFYINNIGDYTDPITLENLENPEISGYDTKILRPNGNYQLNWYSSDFNNIAEEIEYPTLGDEIKNIEIRLGTYTDIFEVSEEISNNTVIKITQLKLWVYCTVDSITGRGAILRMDVSINGKWIEEMLIRNTPSKWFSKVYEDSWAPDAINDILIKAVASLSQEGVIALDCIYLEITYETVESDYQEIRVKTPSTMTYTTAIDYYPATYGFENDEDGTIPEGWVDGKDLPSMTNEIISEMGGHNKVLRMNKADTYGKCNNVRHFFSPRPEYGTLEFWISTNDVSKGTDWNFFFEGEASTDHIFSVGINDNVLHCYNDIGIILLPLTASNNQWYHIRIDFECGTGFYTNLTQFHYRLFIDEQNCGIFTFVNNHNYLDHLRVHQNWRYYRYLSYTDAFAFSWDPNYHIGDNLEEVNPIEGYYPATYGFEDTDDGYIPKDWNDASTGSNTIKVISQKAGHKKVLELRHKAYYLWRKAQAETTFTPQSYGIIEFWYYTSNSFLENYIILESSEGATIKLCFYNNDWYYFDGSSYSIIPGLTIDFITETWYHIQISFEMRGNQYYQGLEQYQWKIRIENGDEMDYSDRINTLYTGAINKLIFKLDPLYCFFQYYMYIDAVGYSWDPFYDMYDNLYEGLLLDIEPDDLDYMECTYFGYVRQIYGDTVFPMPKSGAYTIYVYGEEESSYFYGSRDYYVDFSEGIGVFFYTSDVCEGKKASEPPFEYTYKAEQYVNEYRDVLAGEGYSKLYIYNDMNSEQFYEMTEWLANKQIDSQDELFSYIWAHGSYLGSSSYICITPFSYSFWTLSDSEIHDLYNDIDTTKKGLLFESCHSGGFVSELDEDPYLVMTCSRIDETCHAPSDTREFYFSNFFWSLVDEGYNALMAFDFVEYWVPLFTGNDQHPQMADNMPDGFIFFEN